ncbi:hypothetical protein RRG08_060990 [Elysia crispata]|uniref:Uncharacterized protein n=1 Tax=Elysia crispata TaxID=231223 RepID=A0AAE1AV36_9GAST|nr:hypothetical protein RRG08_060990 [Elysia crispata]
MGSLCAIVPVISHEMTPSDVSSQAIMMVQGSRGDGSTCCTLSVWPYLRKRQREKGGNTLGINHEAIDPHKTKHAVDVSIVAGDHLKCHWSTVTAIRIFPHLAIERHAVTCGVWTATVSTDHLNSAIWRESPVRAMLRFSTSRTERTERGAAMNFLVLSFRKRKATVLKYSIGPNVIK